MRLSAAGCAESQLPEALGEVRLRPGTLAVVTPLAPRGDLALSRSPPPGFGWEASSPQLPVVVCMG